MKLKLIKTAAALAVVATFLAGCKFQGTTADFKEDERDTFTATGGENSPLSLSGTGSISITTNSIYTIADSNDIEVVISSDGRLDEASIKEAINFYPLTANATASYAPARGNAFPKDLKTVDFTKSNGRTSVVFAVKLPEYENNYIAVMVDATKLKEKTGKLILNYDGNDKCGEESDNFVDYISITNKKGGTSTTALGWTPATGYSEDFAPIFTLDYSVTEQITDGKATGALEFTVSTAGYGTIRKTGFASDLNSIYSLRTLAPGETSWKDVALTWTPEDADPSTKYTAISPVLAYGTKYVIVKKTKNSVSWEAAKDVYGHTPRLGWTKDMTTYRTAGGSAITSSTTALDYYDYYVSEPTFIAQAPDNTAATATEYSTPLELDYDTIKGVQRGVVETRKGDGYVVFTIKDIPLSKKVRFTKYDGFVITDNKLNKIKTKAPVVYSQDDEGVYAVLIELEDKNLSMNNFKFWVGKDTTISGKNSAHPNQVNFGTEAIKLNDVLPGYVELNLNTTT